MEIPIRSISNIQFANCRFERNGSDGLVVGPECYADGSGVVEAYSFDNISLTACSFDNRGRNIVVDTYGPSEKRPKVGGVTNFRVIGCFFRQGVPVESADPVLPSCHIRVSGSGCIIGCDFTGQNERIGGASQIIFDDPSRDATNLRWRVIGNHFRSSQRNNPAIKISSRDPGLTGIVNPKSEVAIIGNHFELASDDPSDEERRHPFVWILNGDHSRHVIHSNMGDGQIYVQVDKNVESGDGSGTLTSVSEFSWVDVSPGVPVTLGSSRTRERNRLVESGSISQVISIESDLQPKVDGTYLPTQVHYQVNVSFQWDAGSWWLSSKGSKGFTINWTNPAPTNAQLDWTLHL